MSDLDSLSPPNLLMDTPTNTMAQRESLVGMTLKRRASPSFEGLGGESCRKRMKEDQDSVNEIVKKSDCSTTPDYSRLAEDLAQELQCGCCSELVYRPVIVSPCQHFFCGSCCVLWIRNGGTHCPACRGVSSVVTPSRTIQGVIDALLRNAPHMARTERERQQADEIYKVGQSMRIPVPREASPEPNIYQTSDFARPCPHCIAGNPYGWRCPQPIPDPNTDFEHAWHLEDGTPPDHAHCGNCENLLAIRAPSTTKCDLCQVYFCGIGVQGRCIAAPLLSQHPHGLSDVGDLIQSADVYECFESNTVEVEIMLDYLTAQGLTPRHIYREIISHIQSLPRGFAPLIELDLFSEIHRVAGGQEQNIAGPHHHSCRLCATEVLLWGLREWWIRERQKGFLEESVMNRKDCPDGSACNRQRDHVHAKEFNHIFVMSGADLGPQTQGEGNMAPVDAATPGPSSWTQDLTMPVDAMLHDVPENPNDSAPNINEPDI